MRTSTEQEEEVEREGNGAPTVSFPFTADPMVPSEPTRPGWCWHRLTTLARLATGHTPSRRCPEYWSGDIPWLQLSDIRALDGRRALDTLEHINELGINNSAAMLLPEGTVCLSRTASVGFVTVMGRPMATSQDFVNWVCGPDLSPEFLKWLFIACRKPIRDLGSGAVHQTIYFPTVEQFAVCIPPLAEQERIAGRLTEQLGAVERGRAAAEQRLAAAEALPAALLREVFEGPQASGWETVRLGNLLHRHNEIIHPGDRKSGEAVFVGLEHIESHSGRRIGSGKVEFASMTGRKPTFQRGHIVYGYLRPYLNKVWVADFDGCSSVDQFAFDVNPELADTTFVAAFMRSATFLRRAKGVTTTGQLPRISIDEIAAVDIELPPDLPTQRRLAAELTQKLAAAEGVIARCGEGLAAIEALPAALLRQAIGHGVDPRPQVSRMTLDRTSPPAWQPTRLLRVIESYDTSVGTTKIKTDQTFAYIKALGNRQGPHVLASELVASTLARWFGLTVPDFALLPLTHDACFDLPRGNRTEAGPAFVSRHTEGRTWGGSEAELKALENSSDLTRMIVFDTWVRNCDRHPPDLSVRKPNYANVYLADAGRSGRSRLVALDHTHCFDCGRDLTEHLAEITKVKDEATYGLFPAFRPFLDMGQLVWCKAMLRSLSPEIVSAIVGRIPTEWQVEARAKTALERQVLDRAAFLADKIEQGWVPSTGASDSQAGG